MMRAINFMDILMSQMSNCEITLQKKKERINQNHNFCNKSNNKCILHINIPLLLFDLLLSKRST